MQEMKSEVEEIVEELAEDADLLHDPEHMEETFSASSRTPSVGEISTLSPTDTERSLGGYNIIIIPSYYTLSFCGSSYEFVGVLSMDFFCTAQLLQLILDPTQ